MSTTVANMVFATSTKRLMETGWKGNLPSGPLDMCTRTGASPMRKQSPATSHTCHAKYYKKACMGVPKTMYQPVVYMYPLLWHTSIKMLSLQDRSA